MPKRSFPAKSLLILLTSCNSLLAQPAAAPAKPATEPPKVVAGVPVNYDEALVGDGQAGLTQRLVLN